VSDDRLELEALYAQISDAIQDTLLWGASNPPAEEQLYVHKMQGVLWVWGRCAAGRISGYEPTDEDQHWDEYPRQFLHFYQKASAARGVPIGQHLSRLAEQIDATAGTANKQVNAHPSGDEEAASWGTVEIVFLSDERVQIRNGSKTETCNYAEMGFADGRNGNPNQAWTTLRVLAEGRGLIRDAAHARGQWEKVEKRIQEIRQVLREHFHISADPIPFVEGAGYQAMFKIECGPSCDT
jgi:hypothetical protein